MLNLTNAEISLMHEVSKLANIPVSIKKYEDHNMYYVNFGEGSKVIYVSCNSYKKPNHFHFSMNIPRNKEGKTIYFDNGLFNSFNIAKSSSPERIAKALKKLWEDSNWEKILETVEQENTYIDNCNNSVNEYQNTFKDFIMFHSNNEKFSLNMNDGAYINGHIHSDGSIVLDYASLPKDMAIEVIKVLQKYSK